MIGSQLLLPAIFAAFSKDCRPRSSCSGYEAIGDMSDIIWVPILGSFGIVIAVAFFVLGIGVAITQKKVVSGIFILLIGVSIFVGRMWARFECEMNLCEPLENSEQFSEAEDASGEYIQHEFN
jgi:hypothetical protein